MKRTLWIMSALLLAGTGVVGGWFLRGAAAVPAGGPAQSGAVAWDKALREPNPWGEFRKAYVGESFGMKDMLVAHAVLKPGQEIHPPHQHPEEQLTIVTEGAGTWVIEGKDTPAKEGDVMYSEPWVEHTIRNTTKAPMTFLVVKWGTKSLPAPPKPSK